MLPARANYPYQKCLATNYATNGYPTIIPTTTAPATGESNGVFYVDGQNAVPATASTLNYSPSLMTVQGINAAFFGAGADNATFSARLYGWKQTQGLNATSLWVPVPLLQVVATLSTTVGVASADVVATDRFADTLVLASGFGATDPNGVLVTSPTGELVAHLMVSLHGFGAFQWAFTTGGSATNCNCLFSFW